MRTASIFLFSLLLLTSFGCDLNSPDSDSSGTDSTETDPREQIPTSATNWLKDHGHVLDSSDPEADLDDLEPLREIVGDARVVSLGEATHGTSEFFRMKHRILRFLVEEMGFTAFAIEATMPESFRLNQYVRTGTGNPARRLDNLYFWTWDTQEVLDQIHWMRDYNREGDPDVGFYGFDMQYPTMAMEVVFDFTEDVDPEMVSTVHNHYSCYRTYVARDTLRYQNASDSTQQQCKEGVRAVSTLLDENQDAYVNRTSQRKFMFVRQHARLVAQAEKRDRATDGLTKSRLRDAAMARNVRWLLNYLGQDTKIVLWAHNAHVSEADGQVTPMGAHLDEALGQDVVTIGFSFLEGQANAVESRGSNEYAGLKSLEIPPPPTSSNPASYYEYYFASVDASPFLVDLRLAQEDSGDSGWMYGPKKIRSVGAIYNPEQPEKYFYERNLVSEFDAMIYIEESTPSELLE